MPEAPAHCGSDVPKWEPRSPSPAAESSASQSACAATSRVGVALEPLRLVGPGQPGQVQGHAVGVPVHVDAQPDAGQMRALASLLGSLTGRIMPRPPCRRVTNEPGVRDNRDVRTFRGAWSLAGLAAGAAGLATSYFVAMAMTLRESPVVAVANLVIRLTPGLAGALPHRAGRPPGQAAAAARDLRGARAALRLGRPAGPADLVGARRSSTARSPWSAAWRCRSSGARPRSTGAGGGRLRDLAGRAVAADRAAAAGSTVAVGARAGSRTRRTSSGPVPPRRPHPAHLRDPGRASSPLAAAVLGAAGRVVGRGRRHVEESRRLLRLTAGDRAAWCRRPLASGSRASRPGRPASGELLPHRHRDRRAGDRAEELVAADPRPGRPGDHADLRRPGGHGSSPRPGSPSTACPTRSAAT